jgi:hypothetical protein
MTNELNTLIDRYIELSFGPDSHNDRVVTARA